METKVRYHLLIVEDDQNLGMVIKDYLQDSGFNVTLTETAIKARKLMELVDFDLAVLDVKLPGIDGFKLADQLRTMHPDVPIIFMTALGGPKDRVKGLKVGAHDYVTKPFEPEELKLRIRNVLRRFDVEPKANVSDKKYLKIGKFKFYPVPRLLAEGDNEFNLSKREAQLIMLFYDNRKRFVSREMAYRHVWNKPEDLGSRSYDVYVGKLRKYFESDPSINIKNIHGKGYIMYF